MPPDDKEESFEGIDSVISEPLRFKSKLAIGEDAYASLKLSKKVLLAWDVYGAAAAAASAASSSTVASVFFAPSGVLGILGLGTAVTPIGWVAAAGALGCGAFVGFTRHYKKASASRVTVIPEFINTPMDVLALGIFDLLAPLSLKVAFIDGHIDQAERDCIRNYFVKEWGYHSGFIDSGLRLIEDNLSTFSIKDLSQTLAALKRKNSDCNYDEMSKSIMIFLREVTEADRILDEREEMAIDRVGTIFIENGKTSTFRSAKDTMRSTVKNISGLFKA